MHLSPNQKQLQLRLQPPTHSSHPQPPVQPTATLPAARGAAGDRGAPRTCACAAPCAAAAPWPLPKPLPPWGARRPGCTGGSPGAARARRKRSFTRTRLFVCLTDESFPDRCASPRLAPPHLPAADSPQLRGPSPASAPVAAHRDPPAATCQTPSPQRGPQPHGTRGVCSGGRTPQRSVAPGAGAGEGQS